MSDLSQTSLDSCLADSDRCSGTFGMTGGLEAGDNKDQKNKHHFLWLKYYPSGIEITCGFHDTSARLKDFFGRVSEELSVDNERECLPWVGHWVRGLKLVGH